MQNAFTHWWSTKPWDPVTGLSEYQFRMYSPELGRWLNRDPIEEVGGLNIYVFVANMPVSNFDLLGLVHPAISVIYNCAKDAFVKVVSDKVQQGLTNQRMCREIEGDCMGNTEVDGCRKNYMPFKKPPISFDSKAWSQVAVGCLLKAVRAHPKLDDFLDGLGDEAQKKFIEKILDIGEDQIDKMLDPKATKPSYGLNYSCESKDSLLYEFVVDITIDGSRMRFVTDAGGAKWRCDGSKIKSFCECYGECNVAK
jgi:RHS repeat-associated protein